VALIATRRRRRPGICNAGAVDPSKPTPDPQLRR
jgi:hypothetical protein